MSQLLPKAVVAQWVREAAGDDAAVHKETLDWIAECAEEFVLRLGAAANASAEQAAVKENYRIAPDDVLAALESMGLQRYVDEVKQQQGVLEQEAQKKKQRIASRKAASRSTDATHDELLAEQNALFQQASRKAAREGW